ncbi:PLP-dependent aminotransferase family protein [Streptosporangiaceae bacterium NEAU-GS5]|nr:PLP-dependent aminotransferase family protein [Streptosporangiaceae bacterium NEAU-GS5]
MEDRWSRSELDLHLDIDAARGLRAGLEQALRDAVRRGRLAPGTSLPSSRVLARDLGVARGTVTQAYDQLVAEGYLIAAPRSGIKVAVRPSAPPAEPATLARSYRPPVQGVDLRPGQPDLAMFPRREWLAATRHVMQTAPNSVFGYGDQTGRIELREALAGYVGRACGVVAAPDQIIVCAGYTHAFRLVCQALLLRGATAVAVEDPSLPDYAAIARHTGLQVDAIPVDGAGLIVDRLGSQGGVAVTPAHQFPLGVTMSPARRADLLKWAHQAKALVIEDDYDGEFRYDRQPVGALQGLAPEQVVYVGTASKTIAPGLRMAWLVAPPALMRPLAEVTKMDETYVSVVDQLVFARLIETGELDRHLRRCRAHYRRRRDRLDAAVARDLPSAHLSGIAAGLQAVLHLAGGAEPDLLAHLDRHGVAVDGLAQYYHNPDGIPPGLVIGYSTPPEHAYATALSTLIPALRSWLDQP